MISAFGVDHGISKSISPETTRRHAPSAAVNAVAWPIGSIIEGARAKPGKRANVGFRNAGRTVLEGTAGSIIGTGVGAITRKPEIARLAGMAGGTGGIVHGSLAASDTARRRNWYGYQKGKPKEKYR